MMSTDDVFRHKDSSTTSNTTSSTGSSSPASPPRSNQTGAIAGGAVGGVAALCILAGLTLWRLRRRKNGQMRDASYPQVYRYDMNQAPGPRQTPELADEQARMDRIELNANNRDMQIKRQERIELKAMNSDMQNKS